MADPDKDKASMDILKQRTARLSVISNTGLVILKFVAGFLIGSVSIISEAIHSSMDLIAAIIAFFAVRTSSQPPDSEHEFGHGKFEDMSGLIEAALIFIAAILIIWEAVQKLLGEETGQFSPRMLLTGILIMGFSVLVNWYVSSRLMKVARQTDSIALESDAWHLRTDVYTSLGVFSGLILIRLTGITLFDSIVAIGVALVIMKAAYDLTRRSFSDLLDLKIPDKDEDRIKSVICGHASSYAGFHGLKTRRSGPEIFIEFHLVVPSEVTVETSHDLTDHLENDLKLEFPRATITIHVEPCNEGCTTCGSFCTFKEKSTDKTAPEE